MDRRGMLLMFIGAILLAILLLINLPISFVAWLILFIISMVIAATGTVICMISLGKSIKADYEAKKRQNS